MAYWQLMPGSCREFTKRSVLSRAARERPAWACEWRGPPVPLRVKSLKIVRLTRLTPPTRRVGGEVQHPLKSVAALFCVAPSAPRWYVYAAVVPCPCPMTRLPPCCWVALLALCVAPGLGRAAALSDSTRWQRQVCLGLQASRFTVQGLVQPAGGRGPVVFQGLFPSLSGSLSRRWRGEVAASWQRTSVPETTVTAANGGTYRSAGTESRVAVPLLVRFWLCPRLRRVRVEALAGVVAVRVRTATQSSSTPAGQPVRPLAPAGTVETTDSPLLFGVGAAYALGPHWRVRGDASANWSLGGSLLRGALGGENYPWHPGFGVGFQYEFAFPARPRP